MSLPSARQLAAVAITRRSKVCVLDEAPPVHIAGRITFYGGTDRAAEYASRYDLCLIEPPLDVIARVPPELLSRNVRFGPLGQLIHLSGPVFVKPADPILKTFDAGVYRSVSEVRGRRPIDPGTPVLVADAVEWTSEFRCFIANCRIEAWSPYLSYGRPTWKPGNAGAIPSSLEYALVDVYCGLRDQVLRLPSERAATGFRGTVGALLETGYQQAVATLMVLNDGTTSLYFSSGGGLIGAGGKKPVADAASTFLRAAGDCTSLMERTSDYPLPRPNYARFYLLSTSGAWTYEALEQDLGNNRLQLSPLFHLAHAVIAAVRQNCPPTRAG